MTIKRLAVLLLIGAWNSSLFLGDVAPRAAAAEPPAEKAYRIVPGDVLSITILPASEYSREVTVQPDGKVELPLIGAVLVKGLAAGELQSLLQEKYSRYVTNPQVTVNVRRFSGRRVAIIGQVRAPGYYEFRDGMTVLELVSLAGGLTDDAKPSKTRVIRPGEAGRGALRVNLKAVLDGELSRNAALAPGDTVYVPKGRFTVGAQWAATNILPWLTVATAIATIAIVVHTNTGANK